MTWGDAGQVLAAALAPAFVAVGLLVLAGGWGLAHRIAAPSTWRGRQRTTVTDAPRPLGAQRC